MLENPQTPNTPCHPSLDDAILEPICLTAPALSAAPARNPSTAVDPSTVTLTPAHPLLKKLKQCEIDDVLQCIQAKSGISIDHVIGTAVDNDIVEDMMHLLTNPEPGTPLGGILFKGKAGTGKTMMAKAIAGTRGKTTYLEIGAAELANPKRIEALFAVARALSPTVVLIDECDGVMQANAATSQRMAALKTHWQTNGQPPILVIGSTNHAHSIDESVRRRFKYEVEFKEPDTAARATILRMNLDRMASTSKTQPFEHTLGPTAFQALAEATQGKTGAFLTDVILSTVVTRHRRLHHGIDPMPLLELSAFNAYLSDEKIDELEMTSPAQGRQQREAKRAVRKATEALVAAQEEAKRMAEANAAHAPGASAKLKTMLQTAAIPAPTPPPPPEESGGIEWKNAMLKDIAEGKLLEYTVDQVPPSVKQLHTELGEARGEACRITAGTPDVYASIGVDDPKKRPQAAAVLRELARTLPSSQLRIKEAVPLVRNGTKYPWFVMSSSGWDAFRTTATTLDAAELNSRIRQRGMETMINEAVQRELNEQGLTCCYTCTMPVLDTDDPEFNEKKRVIERVARRGAPLQRCACGGH